MTLPPSVIAEMDNAFARGPLISEPAAAGLIQISSDTLRREAERGSIAYRLRGKRRCYAREDIEDFFRRFFGHDRVSDAASVVYFIRCNEFVKIGYAARIVDRYRTMQTGNPYPLEILAIIRGDGWLERGLHQRFQKHWHYGEWFNLHPDIEEYIASLEPYERLEVDFEPEEGATHD